MITCPICGKKYFEITPSHAKVHGLTLSQFRTNYPDAMIRMINFVSLRKPENIEYSEYCGEKITKRMRREKNK